MVNILIKHLFVWLALYPGCCQELAVGMFQLFTLWMEIIIKHLFFFTQQKPTHIMGQRLQTSVSREEINFLILQSPNYECMAAHHSWCVPHKVLIHIGAMGAVEIPCWECKNCDWAHCVFLYKLLTTDEKSLKKNWKFDSIDSIPWQFGNSVCSGGLWWFSLTVIWATIKPSFFSQIRSVLMLNGLIRMAL